MEFLNQSPTNVRIVEVGPRDGLQNEADIVPTAAKIQYINLLAQAGFQNIEVSSFVSPKKLPQLADAAEVIMGIGSRPGLSYSALVPNQKGLDRALAAGIQEISLFTAASNSFTLNNIGVTINESLDAFKSLTAQAHESGCRVRAYVSTAFHCPFEGPISHDAVRRVTDRLSEFCVDEISIGDTIGMATPYEVEGLLMALNGSVPIDRLALHFHDTRGCALANVLMGLLHGVRIFDASSGGLGGCPFAPGAAGNLATEDLICMLDGMHIYSGVNASMVAKASRYLSGFLTHPLPGKGLASLDTES